MTFNEWLCSSYPNPSKHGEWGLGHIISLIIIAAFIVVSTLLLKKRSEKDKRLSDFSNFVCNIEHYEPSPRICPHDLYYEDFVQYFEPYRN